MRPSDFRSIEIFPMDSVFFGSNTGLELSSSGTSLKFPLPWTVSGAILSALISIGGEFNGLITDGDYDAEERGELTLLMFYGPYLIWKGKRWFPYPHDLRLKKLRRERKLYSSQMLPYFLIGDERIPEWVDEDGLQEYADGGAPQPREQPLIAGEERLGIHLDDTGRTAKRGYLYTATYVRLPENAGIGILAAYKSGGVVELSSIVRIGGEARVGSMITSDWVPRWFSGKLEGGSVVRVALLSPAIYRDGNGKNTRIPDISGLPGSPEICSVQGRRMVVGPPPIRVSGWDARRKRAKRMYQAVPAGTVYYLRLMEDVSRWDLTLAFWKLSLYWERGFGSPLVALSGGVECE